MTIPTLARTSVVLSLALVAAGCGSSSPAVSGRQVAGGTVASASVAPSSSGSASASRPAPSPTMAPTPPPVVVAAASLEPALEQLWQVGGPKPPRDGGCCVSVAPDGKIWVSAGHDSSFWIIDQNGKYLESWGTPGAGDGQFDFVVNTDAYGAVAFDPDGTFYVADTANHRVQKFDKNRNFVMAWGSFGTDDGQFGSPIDIASDGNGHVYVVDNDRADVQEFSADGAYIRTVATHLKTYFIDADLEGRVYVDDGPIVRVFDADGHQLPGIDLSSTGDLAAGMAFDAAGHIYVATVSSYGSPIETKAIYELDTSGAVLHAWPGDADSIALDPEGGALYSSFYVDPFIRKLTLPKP